MFLQQIALYACVGFIMEATGQGWDTPLYWCMLAVLMVSNYLARREGFHEGIETANDVLVMSNRILDEARKYVDDHADKMRVEKQALINKLEAVQKQHKENTNA